MLACVYHCAVSGLAPAYLADDCVLVLSVASRRHLRSADARKLVVRNTRTILNTRDFAVSSAVVWNSLPAELRVSSLTVATFARHLKTHLFRVRTSAPEDIYFALYTVLIITVLFAFVVSVFVSSVLSQEIGWQLGKSISKMTCFLCRVGRKLNSNSLHAWYVNKKASIR